MARTLGGALLAIVLLAAFMLRLRRIERPVFERVATVSNARLELGRVRLARHGEQGRVIGWSVRCDGREVWSRLGAVPAWRVASEDASGVVVRAETGERVRFPHPAVGVRCLPSPLDSPTVLDSPSPRGRGPAGNDASDQ